MILLGSRPLKLRARDLIDREPLDFDFLCTKDQFNIWLEHNYHKAKPTKVYELPEYNKYIVEGKTNCEFEIITPGHSSELLYELVKNDMETIETSMGLIPSLSILLTIKESHKYKKFNNSSINFWKTAIDIHNMRNYGVFIKKEYLQFYNLRQEESYAKQKHPVLNVSKEDFFKDDNIKYQFDHDDIHKSVAIDGKPAYLHYLKDNSPVLIDKNKFFNCSEQVKLNGCIEEACVLAIERSKLPFKDVLSDKQAFIFALAKVCTSITSGYFREYCFDNVFKIISMYPENYWNKFQDDVAKGLIKRIND